MRGLASHAKKRLIISFAPDTWCNESTLAYLLPTPPNGVRRLLAVFDLIRSAEMDDASSSAVTTGLTMQVLPTSEVSRRAFSWAF